MKTDGKNIRKLIDGIVYPANHSDAPGETAGILSLLINMHQSVCSGGNEADQRYVLADDVAGVLLDSDTTQSERVEIIGMIFALPAG